MTLPVSFAREEPLSSDELASLRMAVLDWAASISRLDRAHLDQNLTLTRGARVPLHDIALTSLLESRELAPDPTFLPLDSGRAPAASPVMAESVDVWRLSIAPPAEFKEGKATDVIPDTLRARDCMNCMKEGDVACDGCGATGKNSCAHCRGRGKAPCEACHGMAKTNCLRCNGKGLKESTTLKLKQSDSCTACNGDGKVTCPHCTHGDRKCVHCDGVGRFSCDKCHGKGHRVCPTCAGKGEILAGHSLVTTYKPMSSSGRALAGVPPEVAAKRFALEAPKAAVQALKSPVSEDDVRVADVEEDIRALLSDLRGKVLSLLSDKTRVIRQELRVATARAVRVEGRVDELELVCWIHPEDGGVVAVKNPFKNLVEAAWAEADAALQAGQWAQAVATAQRVLYYDPTHFPAQQLLKSFSLRIAGETVLCALAAGALVALGVAAVILLWERGVHKFIPTLQAGGALLAAGAVAGFGWLPFARLFPRGVVRWGTVFGSTACLLVVLASAARGLFDWNLVRASDTAAFNKEWQARFPHGVSRVFWEPDLRTLESFLSRYEDSQLDLRDVRKQIDRQHALRAEQERTTAEFKKALARFLNTAASLPLMERAARLRRLRDYYKLRNVDVAAAEEPLQRLEARIKALPDKRAAQGVIRVSVTPPPVVAPPKTAKELRREEKERKREEKRRKKDEARRKKEESRKKSR